jgi:hypothetical protein
MFSALLLIMKLDNVSRFGKYEIPVPVCYLLESVLKSAEILCNQNVSIALNYET